MRWYKKIVNGICLFFEGIAVVSLFAMLVVVTIQIVSRYIFSNSPRWTEELARQFMIVFSFIAMALGVRDKLHISVTIVAERLLKKILLPVEVLDKVLIVALGIMMSVFMGPYFTKLKGNILPGSGIPVGYQYLIPTCVGVVMSLVAIYQIYDHLKYGTDERQREIHLDGQGADSLEALEEESAA
jgi:TRAP-type C4-dicarboxylate transport system permease small subunit